MLTYTLHIQNVFLKHIPTLRKAKIILTNGYPRHSCTARTPSSDEPKT